MAAIGTGCDLMDFQHQDRSRHGLPENVKTSGLFLPKNAKPLDCFCRRSLSDTRLQKQTDSPNTRSLLVRLTRRQNDGDPVDPHHDEDKPGATYLVQLVCGR